MLYKPNKVMLEKIALAKSITANIKAKSHINLKQVYPLTLRAVI